MPSPKVATACCAETRSSDDIGRLMGGEEADICFTSPPYALQRDYKTSPKIATR
jgi:DNA modification methylase